jgi:hypothetical protein
MIWLGIIIYWLGAAADFYTSKRALVDSTKFKEGNRVIRWLFKKEGKRTVLAGIKILVFVTLLAIGVPWWVFVMGGVVYLIVGYRNYKLWQKRK